MPLKAKTLASHEFRVKLKCLSYDICIKYKYNLTSNELLRGSILLGRNCQVVAGHERVGEEDIMENQISLCREIIIMGGTMEEALNHLVGRMGEGHFEDTRYLFDDIMEAFRSINAALETVSIQWEETKAGELSDRLQMSIDKMNQSYEDNKLDQGRIDMQFILMPAFKAWIQEIDKCLSPLIQS